MNRELMACLPPLLMEDELDRKLCIYPEYDKSITFASKGMRLLALQDIQDIFLPDEMSREIYMKLYMALVRSLKKKASITSVRQSNQNNNMIRQRTYESIMSGSDSFTIIGPSGIGKSSAISRSIRILTETPVIEVNSTTIIPCIQVQTPGDCSIKSLLKSILGRIDEVLNTSYLRNAERANATIDMLIGSVSQAALNHIGILVVDEIQHVVANKNGSALIRTLTQLINNSGVSICMVGTPDCIPFFEQDVVLARRALGLTFTKMEYNDEFKNFCTTLLEYSYVKEPVIIDEGILLWLYHHSGAVKSNVVALIMEAQRMAIMSGYERLDITILNKAYQEALTMLHSHISTEQVKLPPVKDAIVMSTPEPLKASQSLENVITNTMNRCKELGKEVLVGLREAGIKIVEISA